MMRRSASAPVPPPRADQRGRGMDPADSLTTQERRPFFTSETVLSFSTAGVGHPRSRQGAASFSRSLIMRSTPAGLIPDMPENAR